MLLWRTRFHIGSENALHVTGVMQYTISVYQEGSFSPLLFCISLLPISVTLRANRGYSVESQSDRKYSITHLLYIDFFKLFSTDKDHLQANFNIVAEYTRDVKMSFGLDKCAVAYLARGKCSNASEDVKLIDRSILKHIDAGESYRYLGIEEKQMHSLSDVKTTLCSEYVRRLRKIWSSELSGKNKAFTTNMLAVRSYYTLLESSNGPEKN